MTRRLLLLGCAAVLVVLAGAGTSALSGLAADRSVGGSVAADPEAYVGVTDYRERIEVNASAADPEPVEAFRLVENSDFAGPRVTVRPREGLPGGARLDFEADGFGAVRADVACGQFRGEETVEARIEVAGEDTRIAFTRSLTVACVAGEGTEATEGATPTSTATPAPTATAEPEPG